MISASFMIAAGLVAVSPATTAQAFSADEFDRGNIISDANFYDANAMTEAEIQSFLDTKIGTCANGKCLNVLTQTTYSRPADRTVCAAYAGAVNEPASRVIFKVQQACGISAKVLLVTLQKEMGLVTSKSPTDWSLAHALGYACPDSAPCDSSKSGFYNQVYLGAWQFKRYSTPDVWGGFWAGQSRTILYSPSSLCSPNGKWVTIKNKATAALYNYTPYTPSAAALAAYPYAASGADAACGSYGNRNFWFFYYNWFGSPTDIHPQGITIERQGGADRFETAVQISEAAFPGDNPNVPVVYITDGMNFPDALSAAPAAARDRGPLLLVTSTELPAEVKAEIVRLHPQKIIVTGQEGSISDAVFTELSALAPTTRIGGIDRFDTSRQIAATFPAGTTKTAFIATAAMFPDALSASAVAGALGAPVILVRGTDTTVDQPTIDLLQSLGVTKLLITGGPAAVTPELEASLALVPGVTSVIRYGGANRYIVSAATNRANFTASDQIYVASGYQFPDALAGAAVAGMNKVPLYLTPSDCIYTRVLEDMDNFGTTKMTILGGTGVIGSGVSGFANCH
ncbi:putative cell wall-binding protein [Cryobacterium mesophilum]|uniref:cell wall-binding repeat-containing protein n=1 Tax=Terrimesophilobacter mesophilus TaxID=433647 RepID=UPI001425B645|nr:cell wall-binding repeat-containing protein [Terrimesophilobacter mesophilus]MBB5632649.1 putative cell wall-binding protein [Terrimesophilobacter mesophilus]